MLLGLVSLSMLFDSRQGFRLCLPLNECFKHYGSAMIAPPPQDPGPGPRRKQRQRNYRIWVEPVRRQRIDYNRLIKFIVDYVRSPQYKKRRRSEPRHDDKA